jgi:type VI secretion system protein ImpE
MPEHPVPFLPFEGRSGISMKAKALYQAGKLNEAIESLSAELRDNPTDAQRRTFLFELLCFAGDYDRADKHLNFLSGQSSQAQMGAVLYMSALHAERLRHKLFAESDFPTAPVDESKARGGTWNGQPFESIEDSDPRIGARLELFAAGAYLWIPFEHIEVMEFQPPKRVRELLWRPALVRTGPAFKDKELGEVMVPVLSPFSWKNKDDQVKLGRATVWETPEGGDPLPQGQKTYLIDGEDIPILELEKIEFRAPAPE